MHFRYLTPETWPLMFGKQLVSPMQAVAKLPQTAHTAADGEEAARRGRKRERSGSEVIVEPRWSLKQKLAGLTQDIELLTQEVRFQFCPCFLLKQKKKALTYVA